MNTSKMSTTCQTDCFQTLIERAPEIEECISYSFKDKNLLALAFVHRSFVNENRHIINQHNERLEFLGDSILGFLIADFLYRRFPTTPEGDLSQLRSRLVEATCCVAYVQQLHVEKFLLLGKGERMNDGRGRDSILADLFEAIIGAIFLDGGAHAAGKFLFGCFMDTIESILEKPLRNWKAELQDYSQRIHQSAPLYQVVREDGPDHSKVFEIAVLIAGEKHGAGSGSSKKEAQQAAAEEALTTLLTVKVNA